GPPPSGRARRGRRASRRPAHQLRALDDRDPPVPPGLRPAPRGHGHRAVEREPPAPSPRPPRDRARLPGRQRPPRADSSGPTMITYVYTCLYLELYVRVWLTQRVRKGAVR